MDRLTHRTNSAALMTRLTRQALFIIVLSFGLSAACGNRPMRSAAPQDTLQLGDEPVIRVLILDRCPEVMVAVDGPYEIGLSPRRVVRGERLPPTPIRALSPPHSGIAVGELHSTADAVTITPRHAGTILVTGAWSGEAPQTRRYPGALRLTRVPTSNPGGATLQVINTVSLERYLPSVLEAELYADWHIETYRAQAIAARTYALYHINTFGRNSTFDVRSTEASQVYKGLSTDGVRPKARQAVHDTRGIVCTWTSPLGEKIFRTYFSSACGGMTQSAANVFDEPEIPPLAGKVPCDYCRIGGRVYRWHPVRISKAQLTQRLRGRLPECAALGEIDTVTAVRFADDGRPLDLQVRDRTGRSVVVDSYDFRLAVGGHELRSNFCTITDRGTEVEFADGRGFGHAVGMCQWGAEGQARLGRSAAEILAFYYPQSHLNRAY